MTKKILIIDDHVLLREGIKELLAKVDDYELVGEASDGAKGLKLAETLQPDVVLLDITLKNRNGLDVAKQLLTQYPKITIVMLTMHREPEYLQQAMALGVQAYILKDDAFSDLHYGIETALKDGRFISPTLLREIMPQSIENSKLANKDDNPLTAREQEILVLVASGHSTREIADRLKISSKTVETHRSHISAKLELKGSADYARYALRMHLIALDEPTS